jgi:hypothetical protein
MFIASRCSPPLKTSLAHQPYGEGQLMPEVNVGSKIKSNSARKLRFKHVWFPLTGIATVSSKAKDILPSTPKKYCFL